MEPDTALAILEAVEVLHKAASKVTSKEDGDKLQYLADMLTDIVAQETQYT